MTPQKQLWGLMLFLMSTPCYAANNYLSIYYVPWMLVMGALVILVPIFFRIFYLVRRGQLADGKQVERWLSIMTLPTFIGGVGVSLTFFPLLFVLINFGDRLSLPILLPLTVFCALFLIFTKICYQLLRMPEE